MRKCPNCGQVLHPDMPGHFVPPSLGENGFFICETEAGRKYLETEKQPDAKP